MNTRIYKKPVLFTTCLFALMSASGLVAAQSSTNTGTPSAQSASVRNSGDEAKDAREHLQKSVQVIQKMQAEPGMKKLLQRAKGIYVVPEYGRAALGVGGRGGAGVLFVKQGSKWGNPAFYNMGGISAGLQAGVEGGAIAMVLTDQKAINSFKQDNNFSLNADAGLTVVKWSGKAQGSAGKGDVVMWSDAKGLFGDLAVSVTDINFDEDQTSAFYGQKVASAKDVVGGKMKAPQSPELKDALAALSGSNSSTSMGSSATGGASSAGSSGSTGGSSAGSGSDTTSPGTTK